MSIQQGIKVMLDQGSAKTTEQQLRELLAKLQAQAKKGIAVDADTSKISSKLVKTTADVEGLIKQYQKLGNVQYNPTFDKNGDLARFKIQLEQTNGLITKMNYTPKSFIGSGENLKAQDFKLGNINEKDISGIKIGQVQAELSKIEAIKKASADKLVALANKEFEIREKALKEEHNIRKALEKQSEADRQKAIQDEKIKQQSITEGSRLYLAYEKSKQAISNKTHVEAMANIESEKIARTKQASETFKEKLFPAQDTNTARIKKESDERERVLQVEQKIRKALVDQEIADIKKLESVRQSSQNKINSLANNKLIDTSAIEKLQSTLNGFNTNTAEKEITDFKNSIKTLTESQSQIVKLQNAISTSTRGVTGAQTKYGSLINKEDVQKSILEIDRLKASLKSLQSGNGMDKNNVTQMINGANNSVKDLTDNAKKAGMALKTTRTDAMSLGNSLQTTLGNFGIYASTAMAMRKIFTEFKQGIEDVKNLDKAMTTLKITMEGMSGNALESVKRQSQELATSLSSTTSKVMDAITTFANMGETIETIMNKTGSAVMLGNLTGLDTQSTVDTIQSATMQFKALSDGSEASAMKVTDSMVAISKSMGLDFSKGVQGMAESLKILGSLADQSKMDIDQTLGLIGSGMEKLRMKGTEIATATKTIISRTMRVKDGENGSEEFLKAEKALDSLDIAIKDKMGNMRGFMDIMQDLDGKWGTLTEQQQMYIGDAMGGARQLSIVLASVKNMARTNELTDIGRNSGGEGLKAQAIWADSLEAKMQQLTNTSQIFWQNFLSSSVLKGAIGGMTSLIGGISKLSSVFGSMPMLIASVIGAMTIFNTKFRESSMLSTNTMTPALGKISASLGAFKTRMTDTTLQLQIQKKHLIEWIAMQQLAGKSTGVLGVNLAMLNVKLVLTALATVATTVATIALQVAVSMGFSLAITAIIGGLTKLVDSMIKTKKETKELGIELSESLQVDSKSVSSAEELLKKIQGLQAEIAKTTDIEKRNTLQSELNKLQAEMGLLLPSTVTGLNDQGEAVSTSNGLIKQAIDLKKEEIAIDAEKLLVNNKNINAEIAEMKRLAETTEKMKLAKAQGKNSYTRTVTNSEQEQQMYGKPATYEQEVKFNIKDLDKYNARMQELNVTVSQTQIAIGKMKEAGVSDSEISARVGYDITVVDAYSKSLEVANEKQNELNASKNIDTKEPEVVAISIEEATKSYGESISKAQEYYDIIEKINKAKEMTPELIQEMTSKYPELGAGVLSVAETQEFLNKKIKEQAVEQDLAYAIMIGDSKSYYNDKLLHNEEWEEQVRKSLIAMGLSEEEAYNYDLGKYTTLNELKNGVQNDFGTCTNEWLSNFVENSLDGYGIDLKNFKSMGEYKLAILNAIDEEIAKVNDNMGRTADMVEIAKKMKESDTEKILQSIHPGLSLSDIIIQQGQSKISEDIKKLKELSANRQKIKSSLDNLTPDFSGFNPSGSIGGGSLGGAGIGANDDAEKAKKDKEAKKDVENTEQLSDRYSTLNNIIKRITNSIEDLNKAKENATDSEKLVLIEKEILLLKEQTQAQKNLLAEQLKYKAEAQAMLRGEGFNIDSNGLITNEKERLDAWVSYANAQTGTSKEVTIEHVKSIAKIVQEYNESNFNTIPKSLQNIAELKNAEINARKSVADIIKKQISEEKDVMLRPLSSNWHSKQHIYAGNA